MPNDRAFIATNKLLFKHFNKQLLKATLFEIFNYFLLFLTTWVKYPTLSMTIASARRHFYATLPNVRPSNAFHPSFLCFFFSSIRYLAVYFRHGKILSYRVTLPRA